MKALRKLLDRIKPNFEKGGKLYMFKSTFEGFETFMFVPDKVTFKGSHIRDFMDLKRTMAIVVFALIPCTLFGMWNVGYQHYLSTGWEGQIWELSWLWKFFWFGFLKTLPIIVVSYVVGLGIEFVFAQVRGHEINEGFLVSGMLIPLVMPPEVPLWIVALATAFAVIIGKEVFGGTGMNILNPALLARAFIFFAYPKWISGDYVWIAEKADAFSGATPLAYAVKENVSMGEFHNQYDTMDMLIGNIPGSIGETSFIAIILGAIVLLYTGTGSLRIMFSVFAGGYLTALLINQFGNSVITGIPAYEHLLLGGFAFGAVFMATDPVSAAQTNKGKFIYGFLIGVLGILIRVFNAAYMEGMMLAILLMNVFAPLIDYYVIQSHIKKRLKRAKKAVAIS